MVAAVVVCYSLRIYPTIKPQFGGGAPTLVMFTFPRQNAPQIPDSQAKLIDETEQGYYVSFAQDNQESVYFIRRDLIESVKFK